MSPNYLLIFYLPGFMLTAKNNMKNFVDYHYQLFRPPYPYS